MTIVILMMRWDALGSSKCFCSENEWRRWGALVVVVIRMFWGALGSWWLLECFGVLYGF